MKYPYQCKWGFFAFIFIGQSFSGAFAQNVDSLLGVLNKHKQDDTTKVRLYAATANAYKYTNPDSITILANLGIALADKLHFDDGKADCLLAKTLGCLVKGDLDNGRAYSMEAIKIYGKIHDTASMGVAFYYIAATFYNQSKYEQAIEYYIKTVHADKTCTNYTRTGAALDNLGVCYSTIGNFPEALKQYLESLKVREKANDKEGMATSMGNIGRVYASLGNNKKAIEYINKSLVTQEGSSLGNLMLNFENAGNVYLSVNDTVNALAAFEKAMQIADSANQPAELNRISVNIAEVLITMNSYDKAHELYKRCLANSGIANMPAVDAMIHRGMGRIYLDKKNYKDAIKELEAAIIMFRENEMRDHLSETFRNISVAYAAIHDYANAFKTLTLYNTYRDSLVNDETEQKTQQLQYEYDLQKKQTQIELLAKDNTIAQRSAEKQRAVSFGLVSGIVLLIVIVTLMYKSRQQEKAAREMITQQASRLTELNNYKDKIFSVLAHDLRGPIGTLTASMALLDENVITPKEFTELKPHINQQLSSITLLLDNLLKWSMSHLTSEKPLKKEQLDINNLVLQNINLMQSTANEKKITIYNNLPHGVVAIGNGANIDIVIRNLLSNAVKFTKPGGNITIDGKVENDKLELSFTDTGVGISDQQIKKLFTSSPDNSTSGTKGEKGIGLGLLISYEFAKANNGDITLNSELGKGSTFTLIVPLSDVNV